MSGAYPNFFDPNNKSQSPEHIGESVLGFLLFNAGADAWLRSVIKWNAATPIEHHSIRPLEIISVHFVAKNCIGLLSPSSND